MQDISDEIAANQIWFRHFGCSWQSPKVLAWMQEQDLSSCHAMEQDDFRCLASQMEDAWKGLSEQRQELLTAVNRLLAKRSLAWDKEPLTTWLARRGLTKREEMGWNDYAALLQEFSCDEE